MANVSYRELFANRLRALRIAADLTIERASERGGLSPTFWGTVERNEQEPCLDSIFGFAKGLGISVVTLLTFENEEGSSEDRKELNDLLDLCSPQQLRLALQMSRLIQKYKPETQS